MIHRRTISLNTELHEFLNQNPELSLSKVCQQALRNLKEQRYFMENKIKILENKIKQLQEKLYEANK